MNLEQHILRKADLETRRLSTGLYCQIIRDISGKRETSLKGLLSILKEFDYIPEFANINPNTGYDALSCVCMCVPLSYVDFVAETVKNVLVHVEIAKATNDPGDIREKTSLKYIQRELRQSAFQAVKEHVIIAVITAKGQYRTPNGDLHHVYIHSREQSQFAAEIVPKTFFNENNSKTW